MKIYWFMLAMMFIQTTWSAVVTITPEDIAVEVGTDSVNFTCRVELEIIEAMNEHVIYWWKNDVQLIAYNSDVIMNPNKYSVYGVSSAASTHLYTQTLQIHDISEDDNGTYSCKLVFSSNMLPSPLVSGRLIITDFGIPQPTCFNQTGTSYPAGQTIVTLICSCPSCYSQTILQWFDNEGLTDPSLVVTKTNIILTATFSKEFYESKQWFTCRATRPRSTETKECVIGNKNVTSVASVTDSSITTISQTNGIIPKTMTTTGDINRVTTMTIKGNKSPFSETTYDRSTVESKITNNKDISHTPSISKLISDVSHHMQTEASLPPDYTTSANSTNMLSSSSDSSNMNIIPIITVVVLAVILLVIFIVTLITVGKRKNTKTQNEEIDFHQPKHWLETTTTSYDNEITEEETAINGGIHDHRVISIQLDDVDNQLEYKNSAIETDTDDPDPFYAAVNHTIIDKSQTNEKISDSGLLSTGNTDDPYQAGPAGNTGQQCPMADMADYQKSKAPLERASEYMSTADMEFKRKPTVPAKKLNKSTKPKVTNYPAPNGDMYAQVEKSSKSISNRITTLLRNEEHLREKEKETERNDKLINLTKASLRFMDIDNDDTYSTVSDVIPSKVDEGIKKETEMNENDYGEDDNVSRTSLDSTGSIHYSVDEDTVYAKVLKQQKLTT